MKRVLSLLLAVAVLLSVMIYFPAPASAESLYIRKIVSVVYDDSGSMNNSSKAAYASYAMQAFCGMLNSEDQLYITYMRDSKQNGFVPQKVDLSAGGIQASVDSIRNHHISGGTPYSAVEKAYNHLASVQDTNPNTQYWLVVITDGAFDEGYDKNALNQKFRNYANSTMPNGTNPQVTFLGIGKVTKPDADPNKGIYTYSASDAKGIIGAMSDMADRISGRTRLQKESIRQLDDRTIQVSSTIPLLNIAAFSQGSEAKLTRAAYDTGSSIPISRKVSMHHPGFGDLQGGAFLVGDSQNVIGAGTYTLTFDQPVNLDNVIVLFEPALEMRMSITLNGKEIKSTSELNEAMEGDKLSISCKIYEMGTDKVVDPNLMPPGTKFEIAVSEDGQTVDKITGQQMALKDYVLKNLETQITAAVLIDGFNPIDFSVKFTPTKYVPKIVYSIVPSFGSDIKSIKFNQIANNKDLTVCFTVLADGVAITDPEAVKALNPVITTSSEGDKGMVTYTSDGKIVFTPNEAVDRSSGAGSYQVTVTCTIDDGTAASEVYTVLLATYEVVPINGTASVKRHELFGNQTSASFYITKDGVKLDKSAVENGIEILLSENHAMLKHNVVISPDGTITVTPYSQEEHDLTFWSWWSNWAYYWGLSGDDIGITLRHAYGTGTAIIDIVEADGGYLFWNVWVPLVLEILILAAIIAYIVRYITKPRFVSNGVLYVGSITRNRGTAGTHSIELMEVRLNQYNKFKNLWNPFKELTVSVNGVSITAAKGNKIICNEPFPWYSDSIRPKMRTIEINSPKDVVTHCQEKDELVIYEIKPVSVMDSQNRVISQDDSVYYFVRADVIYVKSGNRKMEVIDSAVAFCYSTVQS